MAQYYVQVDDKNYIAKMAKALTDKDNPADWTQVTVATAKDIDFTNQFDKYYMDPQTHAVTKNHDTTTIGDVNEQLGQALDTIKQQNDQISTLVNTTKDLQTVSGKLGGQLAQALESNVTAQQTIKDLQATAGKLGGQVAKLLADKTASK